MLERFEERVQADLGRPFAIGGQRGYLCGHMNGAFPDMGHHLPGEMGGLWTPPLKLADGFWFGLSATGGPTEWMYGPNCTSFTMKPGLAEREFTLTVSGATVVARQTLFMPENEPGLIIGLTLENKGGSLVDLSLHWLTRFDIQGAWWSSWPDRPDAVEFDQNFNGFVAQDSLHNEWCAAMTGDTAPTDQQSGPDLWAAEQTGSLSGAWGIGHGGIIPNPDDLQGQGISAQLDYVLSIQSGASITRYFAIAGGLDGPEVARATTAALLQNREQFLAEKLATQTALLEKSSSISTPLPHYDRVFDGSKLCLDVLTLDVPNLGRGLTGGYPGFAWFFGCDTYYSVSGLLVSGQADTALDNLRLLARYAAQKNGRTPHEITQTGALFNAGNTVETGEFITAVERAYRWTGNKAFLDEVYPLCWQGVFVHLLEECDPDRTLLPDGPGLLELRSAEFGKKLDVACSLYQGLRSLAYLAQAVGDNETQSRSLDLAGQVRDKINRYFWQPDKQEYAWRIEHDLSLHPDEPAHSYVMLEMGVLNQNELERAANLFATIEGPAHTGPRGLIHPGTVDFVMPIQNCIIALAEFKYNRPDAGLKYLDYCAALYGYYMPWAIPEFVGEEACFLQAWSSAAYNWLIVQGLFRLNPDPITQTITVQPQLPTGWDNFEVQNLNLWGYFYDLKLTRTLNGVQFSATPRQSGDTPRETPPPSLHFEVVDNAVAPVDFV